MFNFKDIKDKVSFIRLEQKHSLRWLAVAISTAVFVLAILGTLLIWFEISHKDRFYPGTKVGDINLSGLTRQDAFRLVTDRIDKINNEGIKIFYQNGKETELKLLSLEGLSDPDLSREILTFDVHKMVYDTYAFGRGNNWPLNFWQQLTLFLGRKKFVASYNLDQATLDKLLKQQFSSLEKTETNASPKIDCIKGDCQVEIIPESDGLSFNYEAVINQLKNDLLNLQSVPIKMSLETEKPQIEKDDVGGYEMRLLAIINNTVEFNYQDKKWSWPKTEIAKTLEFQKNNDQIIIIVNKEKFFAWFDKNIGEEINVPAKNALMEIKDGKIVSLGAHQEGTEVDKNAAYNEVNAKIILEQSSPITVALTVNTVKPEVAVENVNDLGIKEIIGIGKSNFAGSPTNRRKNIKNGASKLHGLLIKPDDEFSLIKTLLPVDAANGYFQELVIKGNKTTPEYGGGLCQIGTTVFRAALASGLPILERQNHSYSVTYYLQDGLPGVDATIYDPKPDMRFKNDTGHYILIQAKIVGDNLSFEFWGTKDGRKVEQTKPKTWGVKSPPATKYIETLDLKPGEKKCTESSHKGISASFDYIVTYPDEQVKKQTFTSVYKPWQAVCLIGVDKLSGGDGSSNGVVSTSTDSSVAPIPQALPQG